MPDFPKEKESIFQSYILKFPEWKILFLNKKPTCLTGSQARSS